MTMQPPKKIITHTGTAQTIAPAALVFIRDGRLVRVETIVRFAPNFRITVGTTKD